MQFICLVLAHLRFRFTSCDEKRTLFLLELMLSLVKNVAIDFRKQVFVDTPELKLFITVLPIPMLVQIYKLRKLAFAAKLTEILAVS